jgi:putative ABC transport system ATP-binding protein
MTATVRAEDLTVVFTQGDYLVKPLDGLNVHVDDGELVLLLGPSGCGKTTLLSCLSGILRPTSGRIIVDGIDVTALDDGGLTKYRRHTVGIVFQAFNLIGGLSARENVMAPLRLAGVRRKAASARAEKLLNAVDLSHRLDHAPSKMSGGQQQRVAIARALVHDPPVLIADEPTAHLDYVQVEGIARLLRSLAVPGRAVLISTHDDRLLPLADRVIDLAPKQAVIGLPPAGLRLEPGEVLFHQGGLSDFVYVLERGEIELVRALADGGEELLRRVEPGGYFGEMGPMLGLPRSAMARALTASTVNAFTVRDFKQKILASSVSAAPASLVPSRVSS